MKILSKSEILEADDLPRELVEVPEWGGALYVRTMTGSERDAFEAAILGKNNAGFKNIRARLTALTTTDEAGNRLFEEGEVDALGKKSAAALDRVFSVAQRLNSMTQQDVEDLEKN